MIEDVIGSFQLMKSLNRSLILNTIRTSSPISRAEIAKRTKLTPPTVSNLVKELLDSELIIESTQGESSGGRKPTMLELNHSQFFIIGLDVGPCKIKAVLTDLRASILSSIEMTIPVQINHLGLLEHMSESIKALLAHHPTDREKLIGIGVGMHGMVDVTKGISLFAPILQLRNIPIKEHLEKTFNMPVRVENDVRAMAIGEAWFGAGRGATSVVCMNVGRGIGAGILFNEKLMHGASFLAGEIGHMTIDLDGPKCSCGNYGCLQALAAGPYIAERAAKELAIGRDSLLKGMVTGDLSALTGEQIHQAAKRGDELSIDILCQTGIYLGIGINNLINILNPDRIIIGGGVSKAGAFVLDSVRSTISQRALTDKAKETDIRISELGDHATAIGAASLLLTELFSAHATGG